MELKRVCGFVRGGPVKKATIAKILKQMIRKGLIKKGEDGRYYPLITRPEIAFSRIRQETSQDTTTRQNCKEDKRKSRNVNSWEATARTLHS